MTQSTLTLFYDGLCPLCSREIAHYRKCASGDSAVLFIDITGPTFDAVANGLDPALIHKQMHVKEGENLFVGVDAFLAIWRRIPGHRWLLAISRVPGVYWLMRAAYWVFAKIRPLLPRRKAACDSGTCQR